MKNNHMSRNVVNGGMPDGGSVRPHLRRRGYMLAFVLTACGGAAPGSQIPTPVNGFRPEDRVVIGDFTRVTALAATTDRVFVAYPTAIAIWKPLERRWEVPRSPQRPEILRSVTGAVVDPLDRTLWLASRAGWIHYDPLANRWDEGIMAVPPARLPRVGVTPDDALRDLPQLRALVPVITAGPLMSSGTLTAAARDPLGNGWYLGTSTRGLLFFDRMATDAQPMSLGLSGDVVGAIALTPDGLWVATDYDGLHPAGLTHLATELDASRTVSGPASRGLPFSSVRRMTTTSDAVWLATDKGVVRVMRSDDRVDRWGLTNGLPDERVLAIAQHRGRIYAGTMRGLAHSRGDSGFAATSPGVTDPVYALLSVGDTLWVGTAHGLFASMPGSDVLRMTEGFRLLAESAATIMGIGYIADTLVALTPTQLLWRDPVSGGWAAGPDISNGLGPLTVLETTPRGAWVGGMRGAAFVQPNSSVLQYVVAPDQLPDELTAIAARGQYLWIGTRAGLVRFLLTTR